ncbi:hypothetical protein QJS04_geneDACA014276 [Acorus gramineus]|uniref:ETFB lysine methyltransferase n=1 Tax=Acorus gramineus TaxID=55184 RepID=A0AAV9BVR3_ACOGR|nr:hypothetical protein QJS04_geneDACA014276 [Acorus gramineus]
MLTASARCLKRLSSSSASPSHHSRLAPFLLSWTTTASNPPTHPPLVRRASHHSRSATATTADGASSANPTDPPFVSVRIRCDSRVADTLSEALICFGASSASMDELDSSESNEETFITSLFVDEQDVQNCILYAAQSIGLHDIPHYEARNGEHYDWLKNVQDSFHPVEVTNGLWIVPEWRTPPDPHAKNIILNPGLAFGTGDHPTTKLCLLLLNESIKGGECILDYGTGSGILGIAALKLGAAFSVGVDIDPQAITSAHQNIVLNKIEPDKMRLYLVSHQGAPISPDEGTCNDKEEPSSCSSGLNIRRGKFDIVIANILLNPLVELAKDIVAYAKPGAIIGLSGIITDQVLQVEKHYLQFLDGIRVSEMDGWVCLSGTRKINI